MAHHPKGVGHLILIGVVLYLLVKYWANVQAAIAPVLAQVGIVPTPAGVPTSPLATVPGAIASVPGSPNYNAGGNLNPNFIYVSPLSPGGPSFFSPPAVTRNPLPSMFADPTDISSGGGTFGGSIKMLLQGPGNG